MVIYKNIDTIHFEDILSGKKPFELRLSDKEYNVWDVFVLRERDRFTKIFTGRELRKTIKYVLKTKELPYWSDEDILKYWYSVIAFE